MISFDHVTLGQRVLFGAGAAADNTALAVSSRRSADPAHF